MRSSPGGGAIGRGGKDAAVRSVCFQTCVQMWLLVKSRPPDLEIRNLTCVELKASTTWADLEKTLFSGFLSTKVDDFTRVYESKQFKMRLVTSRQGQ